jgi:DNA-binding IclR family transcriptional regulator
VDTLMGRRVELTPAHDAVLAVIDWLPDGVAADAALVAKLLDVPEAEAARLLDQLEAAGCVASATGPVQ